MADGDGSVSFYFFDIDDNLLFLQTRLYLWNAESRTEQAVSSGEFAAIPNQLGRSGKWQPWAVREETFRDFRDRADSPVAEQPFIKDLLEAISSVLDVLAGPLVAAARPCRGAATTDRNGDRARARARNYRSRPWQAR
jgi:hypothetical protein